MLVLDTTQRVDVPETRDTSGATAAECPRLESYPCGCSASRKQSAGSSIRVRHLRVVKIAIAIIAVTIGVSPTDYAPGQALGGRPGLSLSRLLSARFGPASACAAESVDESWRVPVNDYDEAIRESLRYRNSNCEAMEYYLRLALSLGPPDAAAREWAEESLCYSLQAQRRVAEALQIARDTHQRCRSVASLLALSDAAYQYGDYDLAKAGLRGLDKVGSRWGDKKDAITALRSKLSTKTFRCVWRIPADRMGKRKTLILATPTSDTPCQKVLKLVVEGAASWSDGVDANGNKYVAATPVMGQEVRLVAEIQIKPYSYRKDLSRFDAGPLPNDVKAYLGQWSPSDVVPTGQQPGEPWAVVDPNTPLVRGIVDKLRGRTTVETAENIMAWCSRNLTKKPQNLRNSESTDTVLAARGGHCAHVANAAAALFRSVGIPARLVRGVPGLWGKSGTFMQHSIVELYLNGIGWVDWDQQSPPWQQLTIFVRQYRELTPKPPGVEIQFIQAVDVASGKYECQHTWELLSETLD